ncbi:MAG: hypothetical protein L3J82_08155, partial [Planctomycetes bacterium]|nr:hypothetical protein [Planctomycetota bacterium]
VEMEQGDFSFRELFTNKGQSTSESAYQNWLASALRGLSKNQYSVHREEEVDALKKPDIRIHNPKCSGRIGIELKVADRWSFNKLSEAISSQLIGQYLKDSNSKHGIFHLCYCGYKKYWVEKSIGRYEFAELLVRLQELADKLVSSDPSIDRIAVLAVNFAAK